MSTIVATPRRRRAALAAVLALATVPLATSGAEGALISECPTTTPCVIVRVVSIVDGKTDETRYAVEVGDNADITDPKMLEYTKRSKPKGTPVPVPGITRALSIDQVIDDESSPVEEWTFSETPSPGSVPSVLDPDQAYANKLKPAVYVTPDGRVGYVRPLRSSQYDVNAGDVFTVDPGEPLFLTVHTTGDLLDVEVTTTPRKKITTKTPVSFSAKVTPNSRTQKYYWNFTGGTKTQDKTPTPTWTFDEQDTYNVNLQVRDPDDGSYGRAATTTIKVGKPPKPPKTPSTGGTGGTGGGSGFGGGGTGYIPPAPPITPSLPDIPDGPSTDEPVAPVPVDDGLQEVEGFVLAGAGAEQGDAIPGTASATQATATDDLSTSRKIGGAVVGTLAVLLLLGLGAEIETRWASTRLAHLRRRP